MLVYNFMFSVLPKSPTGLAMSVLNRTKGFSENNINSVILLPTFNRFHGRDMRALRHKGLLKVPVHYMFDDLSNTGENIFIFPDPVSKLIKEENLTSVSDDSHSEIKRLFKNGKYVYFVKYTSKGKVNFIQHFNQQIFVDKSSYYNDNNALVRDDFFFPNSDKVLSSVYYDGEGKAFLRYLYRENGELYNIIHFPTGKTFESEQDLVSFWLLGILPQNKKVMFISEYAVYKQALMQVKTKLAAGSKLIFTLHNNHYADPYKVGSPIREDFKPILEDLDSVKNVVVLTDEQRQDLIAEFGNPGSFFTVPHAVRDIHTNKNIERQKNTITVGGRFEKIKGIEETIYAFEKVLKKIPTAHLNIIGKGPEKNNYKKLINSLGIGNSCSILNFASNLPLKYAKSDISVFTSYYEGFHLSLIEAMSAGAVPVVFPYKYGPKDIIDNEKSGFVTNERSIDELAEAIVFILTHRDKLEEMRAESVRILNRFSVENNIDHWNNVFLNARV